MAYQINLTGKEIDERLQNIGTDKDVAAADGSLYARISKNADDVDELSDAVGHNKTEQDAIAVKVDNNAAAIAENAKGVADNKTKVESVESVVNQHTSDISALQTDVGDNATAVAAIQEALKKKANLTNGKVSVNELPVVNSLGNINPGTIPTTVAVVEAINQKLTGLLNWKGVEENISDITDKAPAKKGDVWHANEDGSEWVCTQDITTPDSSAWTELGTPIDLSGYYTKDEVDGKVKPLADSIATKASTTELESIKDKINIFDKKLSSGTLRDLYISAGAKYNKTTGYYELNGLTDITEEEMRTIYEKTWGWWLHLPSLNGFGSALPRTNIPCPDYKIIAYAPNISIHSIFSVSGNADNLEVVNLRALYTPPIFDEINIVDFNWAFQEDKKLREVQGIINVGKVKGDMSIGGNIETINIKGLKNNIKFYNSERLSKESVLYMINNSAATSAIAIGLNKAVYDVLKDDADIIAALAEKTNITLIQNT